MSGAGGNRTPVHQAVTARATTIPECGAHAAPPPGRLTSEGGPRIVFPIGQRSFPPPACFQAVILRFCCRAAVDRPRAALRLTMSVYSPEDQAARANCWLAVVVGAPFSESEQLGSHARPAKLMSKPVSPVDVAPPGYRTARRTPSGLPARPVCRRIRGGRALARGGSGRRGPGRVRQSIMPLRWRPRARAASRWASRSAMAWRWSPLRRPRARASSTLARPSLK